MLIFFYVKKVRSYILKVVYRYVNVYSFLLYLYIYVLLLTRFHHVHVSLLFLFISSYVCNDLNEIKNMFCSVLFCSVLLIFFVEKNVRSFAVQKLLSFFFSANISLYMSLFIKS